MVRPGVYKVGSFFIEKTGSRWHVFRPVGPGQDQRVAVHKSLGEAQRWARANLNT